MDNKELDRNLKGILKDKIHPSKELEEKLIKMVEKEKMNRKNEFKKVENISNTKNLKKSDNTKKKKSYKYFARVLSMAAVILVVFTLGMNLKTAPIIGDDRSANLVRIKAIEPTKLESGVLANNSEFTIYVEGDNINTEVVQKSIYVEPALEYTIEKTLNKNEYKLKFKQNIPDNTIVKLQYVKNQITEDSWAYQTSNKFSITSTFPNNHSESVSQKSVIEVEFSYANVENLEKYINIEPKIKGQWEHLGKIWRFTPIKKLSDNTWYTVKISKQLSADKQKLGEDYSFKFFVSDDDSELARYNGISIDGITTFNLNENIKIPYNATSEKITFEKAEIAKFSNIDDFINYVENKNYSKAVKYGEYKLEQTQRFLELKKGLEKGYYVAKIKNDKGKELFNCPLQISDISAYAMETERDVLVWVAKGNELASNINVEYLEKNVKTDKQGIAKFENIADNSEKIKYAKVGNELVIGVYNYNLENYPSAYIYTDRPIYKNTDTINIWGVVPRKLFYEKQQDDFYIEINTEEKQKIKVSEDGNFTFKYELKNHIDDEQFTIDLMYKNAIIGSRTVGIKNYELQNYTYEVSTNKNYGFVGDTIQFDVKVNHITGLLVPNKKVIAKYENNIYKETTGQDGVAHFKIKLTGEQSEYTEPLYQGVSIFNGDGVEYTNAETYLETYLLAKSVYMDIDYANEKDNKVKLYKLDTTKNAIVDFEVKDLYNGTYETSVDVNLIEEVTTWYQDGEEYNEYTKKMEPHYESSTTKNTNKLKTVKSINGMVEILDSEIKKKENTDNKSYSYTIELVYKDPDGRKITETLPVIGEWYNQEQYGYHAENTSNESNDRTYEIPAMLNENYYSYRYFWHTNTSDFSIGEKAEFKLKEATKNGIKEIENSGKILNIFFKENIMNTNVLTQNNFSRDFTKEDFPGVKMTSAYFVNGKFYRMPDKYFDFKKDDKKANIEITADKEVYKPGDQVTLNIKTTKDGKGIKSFVNVSVVNEAVFKIVEDTADILDTIYRDKDLSVYTYSSYLDDITSTSGGEGGGDGAPRGNFGDTAYFETIYTDKNGNATVKFKLPDNVTTYRVTAQSANEDLEIGTNTKQITSTLDFFIQSVEPRGIKTQDDLVLNATAIANTKYDVDYEFTIKELSKTLTAKGKTNNLTTVNFGKLPFGTYTAVIKGKHGEQQDAIEYKFNVVSSMQEVSNKTTINVNSNSKIKPSKNPIVLELYNKRMNKYVEYIDFVESTVSERLDTQIANNKVQEIKEKYYSKNSSTINKIDIEYYLGNNSYLKNLKNGKENLLLTALTAYYAKDYTDGISIENVNKNDNIFEYYLVLAAKQKPVLQDLLYLKDEKDITNYNKLMITLGLEFVGDYKNAKDLYGSISLTEAEANEYKSIVAIIDTFINKDEAKNNIDGLIKTSPADEYLRFAILSFFQNNSNEIGKEETIKVKAGNLEENVTLNQMQIKTLTLNNEQLNEISFDTESQDIMVSYYYQTMLENIEAKNIKKDIKISENGKLKTGNTVNLKIEFNGNYEGEVRIALPNCFRLSHANIEYDPDAKYYIQKNNIDYITIYKTKKCKTIKLPLLVINEGNYVFENIVCKADGTYHISNAMNIK